MAPINGTKADDFISGTTGDDDINAKQGDDTLFGGEGDDSLDGKQGHDTAVYSGSILDYLVTFANGNKTYVTDQNLADGDEGTDLLQRIEAIQFDDYTLNIDGTNNGPFVVADNQTTDEETATTFSVDAYDFDGDSLSLDDITYGGLGVLTLVSTTALDPSLGTGNRYTFSFDPNGAFEELGVGETATETVTIQVSDGNGGVETISFDITIDGVNDPPVANDDAAETEEGVPITIDVLANDTDIDGDALTVTSASADNGTVEINEDGTLTYTPDEGFDGEDTITYTVEDPSGESSTATVDVTVVDSNADPIANEDSATVDEDGVVEIDVLANDSDPDGNPISLDSASAENGEVVIGEDGVLIYSPDPDFNGSDTITYQISDGEGGIATGTVTVTVNPVNDAPDTTAPDDPAEVVNEVDGIATIDLLGRTSDVEGDTVTVRDARLIDPESGNTLDIRVNTIDGSAVFDPAELGLGNGESLNLQIQYFAEDDSGGPNDTSVGLIDITINGFEVVEPENQAPVAGTLDLSGDPAFEESDGDMSIDIGSVISDPDGDPLTVTALLNGENEVSFTQVGTTLTFDPQEFGLETGQSGVINLTFIIDDGSGAENSTATGGIIFNLNGEDDGPPPPPDNNAPIAAPLSLAANEVDGAIVIDLNTLVSDPDEGDILMINGVDPVGEFPVEFTLEEGILTIDPASFGLDDGQVQTFDFTYRVTDDSGEENSESTGTISIELTGFTEGDPPDPDPVVTLDFEPFADEVSSSIDITDATYEGFTFQGSAIVIETDELEGGGRDPSGVVGGQTTPGGDNVLVGTFSTVDIPLLDENGDPIIGEDGEPLTENVPDDQFGIFGPGSTFGLGDLGIFIGSGLAGSEPPPLPEELPEGIGDSFSLDGLSLNAPNGGLVTVTVTTYTIGVSEVPVEGNPSFVSYFASYEELDTFEFVVDSTTPASELDFNDPAFMDALGNTNAGGFDDIYAVSFETDDGTAMVFDDILITL